MSALLRNSELILILGVCFVCFFWQLGRVELHDFNEGLYVSAAREMYLRGEWSTPRHNGTYFFDKPPLALWCSAVCFRALGVNELAARLPVALATMLLTLLTFWLGTRWFGRRAGLYAGCVFATSPMVLVTARQMTMDLHQSLWFAVAMVCFYRAYIAETARGKRWYYGMWAACGLGFMAKSVPGLFPLFLAFGFVCVDTRCRLRDVWRRVVEARVPGGILLLLAITAPWHYFAYRAAGLDFYREYFLHHHVDLLTGRDFSHKGPLWYYIPSLLGGLFPWSAFLIPALMRAWRGPLPPAPSPEREGGNGVLAEEHSGDDHGAQSVMLSRRRSIRSGDSEHANHARRFLLTWTLGLILMFSAMSSKLHSYLLPMYAAAALLIGDWLSAAVEARRGRALAAGAIVTALVAVALVTAGTVGLARIAGTAKEVELHETMSAPALHDAIVTLFTLAIGVSAGAILILLRRRRAGVGAMFATMTLCVGMLVAWMLPALNATINRPLHDVARVAGRYAAEGTPVAIHIGGPVHPSVYFYMPPSLALRAHDPTTGQVLLASGERPPIDAFLVSHRPAYVMTDTKRAAALLATTRNLSIEMQRSRWVLLRASPLTGVTGR